MIFRGHQSLYYINKNLNNSNIYSIKLNRIMLNAGKTLKSFKGNYLTLLSNQTKNYYYFHLFFYIIKVI